MQILKPTATIFHDTRRIKKNGLHPVKLRVTFNREQQYYPTKVDLSQLDFSRIKDIENLDRSIPLPERRELKSLKLKIDAILVKAHEVIDKLSEFSFDSFERVMFSKPINTKDVYSIYDKVIDSFKANGQLGTASNYQCSCNSLKKYKRSLHFRDITTEFLFGYEKWLLDQGKSISTVGIYLRPLRAIVNIAIEEGYSDRDIYPFTKRRYQLPASKNIKKALTQEEVSKIYHYQAPNGSWLHKAKDMWLFSYLANGMNMKDIAQLKHENIDGNFIRFSRAKTKNSNRSSLKLISIYISSELKKIIDRWKTENIKSYLFPVLEECQDLEKQRSLIIQFTKMVNKYIGKIAIETDIQKPVTTYSARHSFATILKRKGVNTELISEALGHSSIKTTASYLDSFDDEVKKQIGQIVSSFE